jgi:hypothetical protein
VVWLAESITVGEAVALGTRNNMELKEEEGMVCKQLMNNMYACLAINFFKNR